MRSYLAILLLPLAVAYAASNDQSNFTNRHREHATTRSPIIFVAGIGGNQLEARLNKTHTVHKICTLKSDWFGLWLNVHLLAPIAFDCLIDNLRLRYDRDSRRTFNTPGVEIRVKNFGSVSSMDYLDAVRLPKTDYFENIVRILERDHNYTRDVDMFGAPCDFRKSPNELEEYFDKLRALIMSSSEPVTLICHSMGCVNLNYMLTRMDQSWKDTYIKRLVCLGAPFGGSFRAIVALLYGDNLGISLLDSKKMSELQSTFPSLMYLFPKSPSFMPNYTIIETPNANYSLSPTSMRSLLVDALNMTDQYEMWQNSRSLFSPDKAPGVELWCLHGSGHKTPKRLALEQDLTPDYHKIGHEFTYGDGDGTVNLESLTACKTFASLQRQPVRLKRFESLTHIDMLRASEPADFITKVILADDRRPTFN